MPRVQPKVKGRRKLRDDDLCRALEANYANLPEGEFYVATGQEYLGDHPVVRNNPESFMPASTPTDEVLLWLRPPPEPVTHVPDFNIPSPPEIDPARAVIAVEWVGTTSRSVKVGTILDVGDPLVRLAPTSFCCHKRVTEADVEVA